MINYVRELRKKCSAMEMKCFQGTIASVKVDILLPCSLYEYLEEIRQLGVDTVFYSSVHLSGCYVEPRRPGDPVYQRYGPDPYAEKVDQYNAYIARLEQRILGRCIAIYQGKLLCWQHSDRPDDAELSDALKQELHIPLGIPAKTIRSDENTFDYAAAANALDEENQ